MNNPTVNQLQDQERELKSMLVLAKQELTSANKEENKKWANNVKIVIAGRTKQLEAIQANIDILNNGGALPNPTGPTFGYFPEPKYGF